MPSLPGRDALNQSVLLQKGTKVFKATFSPTDLNKPVKIGKPVAKKLKLLAILFVILLIISLALAFVPGLLDKKEEISQGINYPVDVAKVQFPSELNKQKFLDNVYKYEKESNPDLKYQLLENNFTLLLGFYKSYRQYDNRVELEKLRVFISKEHKHDYSINQRLYEYPCLDDLCTEQELSTEIVNIRDQINNNTAFTENVKKELVLRLENAEAEEDKTIQGDAHINTLSMIFSEYDRTKDESIKNIHGSLLEYIEANFPTNYIPEALRLE